jgi:hypothetical protein
MKTFVAIWFFAVAAAQACPPMIERNCTVRGPGGAYGYMHVSYNNQLRRPGEPPRIDQHVILVGPWSFDATGRGLVLGSAGLLSVVGVACIGWRVSRRHDNAA